MDSVIRRMTWVKDSDVETLLDREWLVTNGLGGYASGTVAGVNTRRYHGLLIASLPAPNGRMMMFNHLSEIVHFPDGTRIPIGGEERALREFDIHGAAHLTEFRLENGMPVWQFNLQGRVIEKRILMPHMQNTVHISYRMVSGEEPVTIELRPSMHFRPHGDSVGGEFAHAYHLSVTSDRYEIVGDPDLPMLRMYLHGDKSALTIDGGHFREIFYRAEADRGYDSTGSLWSPGFFSAVLMRAREVTLVASTEDWIPMLALSPEQAYTAESGRCSRLLDIANPAAKSGLGPELVLAADQFVITPVGRTEHEARARAAGEQVFTVIAGYYWFTDWGRDTMISLEGLTLDTGRFNEAAWILGLFADYIRDGLIPNLFPEGKNEGLYHTADATLWFFHSLNR